MASLANDPGGTRRIQVMVNGARKTLRLGKMPKKQAEGVLRHVEALAAAKIDGSPPGEATARWLVSVSDDLRDRLAKIGLATPSGKSRSTTVGEQIDEYRRKKYPGYKPGTIQVHDRAFASMRRHLGDDTPMAEVTGGDAEDFRDAMLIIERLAEATVRKRCAVASKLFRYAIKHRIIDRDPFDDGDVPRGNVGTSHHRFIDPVVSQAVIDQLPGQDWRLLFALSRWGGLRIGSEPRRLRWGDIDWANSRMTVTSPKTERYVGKAHRTIPLFPELAVELEARFDEAKEGDDLVLPMLVGRTDASLRKPVLSAIARAGVEPWPKLWHNLRATRQTELEQDFPTHVVCSWLGNTRSTAEKHYLMVTEDHFAKAAQNPAQQVPAEGGNRAHSAKAIS